MHFHGLELSNDQDGAPFTTQPPVKPGESYTYQFSVPNAGSHMYHSHHNAAEQVGKGLLGACTENRLPLPPFSPTCGGAPDRPGARGHADLLAPSV